MSLTAEVLEDLVSVLLAQDRSQLAARLYGSAEAFRSAIGAPSFDSRRAARDRTLAELRTRLGEERYTAAWAEGSELAIDQAAAEVLATWPNLQSSHL
jgi:hypothetical protein